MACKKIELVPGDDWLGPIIRLKSGNKPVNLTVASSVFGSIILPNGLEILPTFTITNAIKGEITLSADKSITGTLPLNEQSNLKITTIIGGEHTTYFYGTVVGVRQYKDGYADIVLRGVQGPSGTLAIGTITTGAPGSSASVTNVGTPEAAILNMTIPRGDVGPAANPNVITPDTTFAIPIGANGTAPVPQSIRQRFKHFASTEDFGISLFETDGTTIKDNTAAFQDAIDKLQAFGGALFIPPRDNNVSSLVTGPLTMREGTGYQERAVAFIGMGAGDPSMGTRNFSVAAPERYTVGTTLKLKANSNQDMFTMPPGSGGFVCENLIFDGNKAQQTVDSRGLSATATVSVYGTAFVLRNSLITNFGKAGVASMQNRRSIMDHSWIMYCGNATEAAFLNSSYDSAIRSLSIGGSGGVGFYFGSLTQGAVFDLTVWDSGTVNGVISEFCQSLKMTSCWFDGPMQDNLRVLKFAGTPNRNYRTLIAPQFSTRDRAAAGGYPTDTWSDIWTTDDRLTVIAPTFAGNIDNGTVRPKWGINNQTGSKMILSGESYRLTESFVTGFTNDWTAFYEGGDTTARPRKRRSGTLETRINTQFEGYQLLHDDGTAIAALYGSDVGGKSGQLALRNAGGVLAVSFPASNASGGDPTFQMRSFANNAAADAAVPPVPAGYLYWNTTTNTISRR